MNLESSTPARNDSYGIQSKPSKSKIEAGSEEDDEEPEELDDDDDDPEDDEEEDEEEDDDDDEDEEDDEDDQPSSKSFAFVAPLTYESSLQRREPTKAVAMFANTAHCSSEMFPSTPRKKNSPTSYHRMANTRSNPVT